MTPDPTSSRGGEMSHILAYDNEKYFLKIMISLSQSHYKYICDVWARCYLKTRYYGFFCGCSIISKNWILTAVRLISTHMSPEKQESVNMPLLQNYFAVVGSLH